jgi:para-aminobenzoate synthetase component I
MRLVNGGKFIAQIGSHPLCEATPADVFAQLDDHTNVFWLDSGDAASGWSYLGIGPSATIQIPTSVASDSHSLTSALRVLRASGALQPGFHASTNDDEEPPFCGGWVGMLGYPPLCVRDGEVCAAACPRAVAALFDTVLAYSHAKRNWWIAASGSAQFSARGAELSARDKGQWLLEQFASKHRRGLQISAVLSSTRAETNFTRAEFEQRVRAVKAYISDGDIYQLNLAQCFDVEWKSSAAELYLRMRQQSPAMFGAFLGPGLTGGRHAICSLSPELFLRVRGRNVLTCPIKGTRPRSINALDDARAKTALQDSAKERAELNMIVDLERNDLGKVCEFGSVRVEHPGEVQQLPTLYHRIASISGTLRKDVGASELLRATFPGGSITGAPKIRAMQLIEELEPCERGPYCGAIGWLGFDGNMDLNIAIRTAVHDRITHRATYHAGSGIVADSDPAAEYDETLHKAAAFLRAINAELPH